MFERAQRGRRGKHPTGEDALGLLAGLAIVYLNEGLGLGRLLRRNRVAITCRDGQRAEAHRQANGRGDVDRASGDFVETAQDDHAARALRVGNGVRKSRRMIQNWCRGLPRRRCECCGRRECGKGQP